MKDGIMTQNVLPCIRIRPGEIPARVITCGDPARAERIGGLLENGKCLARNREFWTFTGTWKGTDVAVVSHGVGAGGATIAFESLWRAGARVIIRTGTCGGMQEGIDAGSIVIATAACREEGVTEKIVPLSYPAVADVEVVGALRESASGMGVEVSTGICLTQALFFPGLLKSTVELYAKAGVLAMENELASLLVVASLHGVKAGGILVADAKAFELVGVEGYAPDAEVVNKAVERQIEVALDAIIRVAV